MSALLCALIASAVWALIAFVRLMDESRRQVHALPAVVHAELDGVRSDARAALAEGMTMIDRRLADSVERLDGTLNRQSDSARDSVIGELDAMRVDTRGQLEILTDRVDAQLTRTNDSVARVAAVSLPLQRALEKVDSALPFYTDCDAGMCLANLIYGVAKNSEKTLAAVDRTMEVVAAATPPVAESVQQSASAVAVRSRQSIWRNLFWGIRPETKNRRQLTEAPDRARLR